MMASNSAETNSFIVEIRDYVLRNHGATVPDLINYMKERGCHTYLVVQAIKYLVGAKIIIIESEGIFNVLYPIGSVLSQKDVGEYNPRDVRKYNPRTRRENKEEEPVEILSEPLQDELDSLEPPFDEIIEDLDNKIF